MQETLSAETARPRQRSYTTGIGLAILHLGALLAFLPVFFSWPAVALAVAAFWLCGGLGVALSFHRFLTHRSLKLSRPVEYVAGLLGTLALQGGPIEWVATHRKHHAFTDAAGDPHNIHRGIGWAHVEWLYRANADRLAPDEYARWAPELVNDPYYRFLERFAVPLQLLLAVAFFALGGWPFVIWGIFVRIVVLYHVTWLVNSASHTTGYRSYRTGDRSTNCWWVGIMAFGEGWHNNHHAFPSSARHGLRWFEFDSTWLVIRMLRRLRLAWEIKTPTPEMLARLAVSPAHKQTTSPG